MLKFQDFKAYGSIRKTKIAGACGVIIALATLGIVFGSNNVSADEVKPTTPATTEVAKPTTETAKPEAKAEETVKSVESPNLDSAVEKAKSVGINVTEKEKVGYDTEAEAKEDEAKQTKDIDEKIAEKEQNIKEIKEAETQNSKINADNKSAMDKAGLKHTGDYPKDKKTVDGYNAQAMKENEANEAKFKKDKLEAEKIKAKDKAIMEKVGLKFTGNYAQDQKAVDEWNKANAGKVIKSIQTGLTATANTTFEVISGGSKAVAPDYTANVIQGYARNTNLDANFNNVFLLDDKSGTIKIKVKNTTNGDVTLTFSDITPSAESGFVRSYVALWAGEDGGIGYGVFISAGAGEANGGGGVDGQSGGGASGAYRNDRQGWVKKVTVGVLTDSDNVSEVTVNDVDSNQVIDVSNLDGAKVTTGANISQSGNSFTANDSAQSQSTAGVLDSNGIGWSFAKGQKINFTFIHSNTSDTSFSIVGGVFGRASQKEVKQEPISIEKYNDPKYTSKPMVSIKPYVAVPKEKQVEVEYHKAYVKEKPVTPETPKTPEKPKEHKPELPNTGTAESSLGFAGVVGVMATMVGVAGFKRKED
ncbi:LPXTG cell wall anchor domain-containing protein [Streptococcus gordonii]|jgi:agglutinin receptor|uniref:LPXTG cell wall anchor domain-containing protein n=1 Tax=Streptococcus gordonii TaxID=1302 RepID=UPI00073B5266|nr:LPXTG cell wall anchor domain-containing protein [Streptococcus gordonii]KTF20944.1 signal protein [Streptococcus gordonii]KXC03293.1 signal protein [Streptococcus gordonii]MBZ2149840.1 LPXTG cell wall anchor domain-containing protein [Streptococcus gordonii]QWZ58558.1 LPXTG cell wall anchor domain-containing protein [Streptococcus gordonii]SQF28649.1 Agglutinin receptor [Streptococcus gordonii]